MWSIWLCGRCAGYVRPSTERFQPGQQAHDRRTPEVEVAGDAPRAGRSAGSCGRDVAHVRDRARVPELRRRVQPDDVDAVRRRRDTVHAIALRTSGVIAEHLAHRQLAPVAAPAAACTTASSQPPAGRTSPGRHVRCLERREVRRAHRPALVCERVEQTRAVVEAERLRYHDDVGVEPAHERGDVEAARAVDADPADAPMRVERRDGERRESTRLRCRCAARAARGGTSGRRGRSRSTSRA